MIQLNKRQLVLQLKDLVSKYKECFSYVPGKTSLVVHDIELTCKQPLLSKPHRNSPRQNAILKAEIQKMLKMKIIEIGFSDFTSPMNW